MNMNNLLCNPIDISLFDKCSWFKTGEQVYRQNSISPSVYLVKKGFLKIYRTGPKGQQQIIRLVKEGDIIGYHSHITKEPENTACECLVNSVLCKINTGSIEDNIKINECLSTYLLKATCDEMKHTCDSIVEMSQRSVRSRSAKILLKLKDVFETQEGESFPVRISRDDLAGWVGTCKESISRSLNEFKKEGLIVLNTKDIAILNSRGLKKVMLLW